MKLRNHTPIFLIFLMLACQSPKEVTNFEGLWEYGDPENTFSLDIRQKGASIVGEHCSVVQRGEFRDCSEPGLGELFTGKADETNTVIIHFTSTHSNTSGTAMIRMMNNNIIEWKILKKPSGEFYIPEKTLLRKSRSTIPRSRNFIQVG